MKPGYNDISAKPELYQGGNNKSPTRLFFRRGKNIWFNFQCVHFVSPIGNLQLQPLKFWKSYLDLQLL